MHSDHHIITQVKEIQVIHTMATSGKLICRCVCVRGYLVLRPISHQSLPHSVGGTKYVDRYGVVVEYGKNHHFSRR